MSEPNQALATREVEYLAFGTNEKIRLTVGMVRQYVAAPAYDRKTQAEIQISDREAMQFVMLCKARQLNVWEGDAFAVPFWDSRSGCHKWALITAHNAFLKRAEIHPAFEGMESGIIVEADGEYQELPGDFVPDAIGDAKVKLVGGWAKVYRKDRKVPTYRRAKLLTFQKDFGQWVANPAGMIVKVCESDALRSTFPNTCGGMYLREEMGQLGSAIVQAEPSPERRPDFGQIMDANRPASAQRKPKAITQAAKSPQDASGQQPATPSQPPQETAAAPAEPPQQANNEPPQTIRNEPENPPAETTGEPTVPPEEDLSTPPEPEPPQQAEQGEAPAPFVPDTRDTVPVQNVKRLCHEAGLTVEQLLVWARAKKIAKPEQKVNELAEQKLVNIEKQWATILPIIRQTAQAAGQ